MAVKSFSDACKIVRIKPLFREGFKIGSVKLETNITSTFVI